MFIDKDSIKVKYGNNAYVSLGNYITGAQFGYHKIWGKDAGRSLSGRMSGSLTGIYPKLTVTFRRLTKSEAEIITPILDSQAQTVRYYDPTKRAYREMETYTNDYEILNKNIIDEIRKNESFEAAFIAVDKRS